MGEGIPIPLKLERLRWVHEAEVHVRVYDGVPVRFELADAVRLAFTRWLVETGRMGEGRVRDDTGGRDG